MTWFDDYKQARRLKQLAEVNLRIQELSDSIEGIDSLLWDDIHAELMERRATFAWKRSDLLKALA
jgi:hypothetical protein